MTEARAKGTAANASEAPPSLENIQWELVRLGDTPVHAASPQQAPHFVLNSDSRRVSGSGGCNRITGSYNLHGDRITFSRMATTMMACLTGMDTEKTFLDMLKQVNRFKITGQKLELLDANGHTLARFEARELK